MSKRYICSPLDAVSLAALQLQRLHGDMNHTAMPPGYL